MDQKTILIADDDPVVRKLLDHDLTAAGYKVVQAENGETAVQLAKRDRPDLIILDIMMPGMDGGDAGQILRGTPRTWDIPIVFLSTLVTSGEQGEENADGPEKYVLIAKPYRRDELLQVVQRELQARRPVGRGMGVG